MKTYGYDIYLDGYPCLRKGLVVPHRPNIPTAKQKTDSYSLYGRDGNFYKKRKEYEDIQITIEFAFKVTDNNFLAKCRELRPFLTSANTLSFSDDQGWFYKIKNTVCGDFTRENKNIGKIEVVYTCDPYIYSFEGTQKKDCNYLLDLYNPYEESKPIIEIKKETFLYFVNINGHSITLHPSENADTLFIDGELGICYEITEDGIKQNLDSENLDFDKIILKKGSNTITVNPDARIATIQPNWRSLI